jgi:hypothetical protein
MNPKKRLVEEELMQDKQLALVVALLAYGWDFELFDDFDEFLPHWEKQVKMLTTHPGWMNGGHEGDCTKVPATCFRCLIEGWIDEGKTIIQKYLPSKSV